VQENQNVSTDKSACNLLFVYLFLAAGSGTNSDFDLTAYQQFLHAHQNFSAAELLDMHPPGLLEKNASISWE
jgi:hypothetical protein